MMTVSLVTITFRAERVLQPTLDSVMLQDYAHIQHIIIDGASDDGTMDIVRTYERQCAQSGSHISLHVVSEPDNGIYDAMNKGLRLATGSYVCFLNAGDRLADASTLTRVMQQADNYTESDMPAVIYGDTNIVDDSGTVLRPRHLRAPDTLTWRSFRRGMLVCHQAFYARTDIARNVNYNLSYRYSADVDWCIRVMKEADRRHLPMVKVDGVVAHYLEEGATTEHHKESLHERFQVMRSHYGLATTVVMHLWFAIAKLFKIR